jgi:glycosyltransferase involved in cell wall biosynthesis
MFGSCDVSVIIPVYNPSESFLQALHSVAAEQPGEIVIVDDASTQPLPELDGIENLRVLRHAGNLGPGAARNTGLRAARQPWIAFNDADDLWKPGRLALQLGLARREQVEVVMGKLEFIDHDGGPDPLGRPPRFGVNLPAFLVRREVALKYTLDEAFSFAEDLDFYVQLKEDGVSLHQHHEVVMSYRRHPTSLTAGRNAEDLKSDMFRTLSRSLARRRAMAMEAL